MAVAYTDTLAPALTLFRRVDGPGVEGLVAINIREETLGRFLGAADEKIVMLLHQDGTILFESSGRYGGQPLGALLGGRAPLSGAAGSFSVTWEGENFIASYGALRHADWTCLLLSPYTAYAENFARLRWFVVLSLGAGVLLSGVMATLLGMRLSKPMRQLARYIETQNRSGTYVDDELRYILLHLISLYDETRQLEQEQLSAYSALRQAQARALQAQITPHFLHNTLQAVQWLVLRALRDEGHPAVQALTRLADLAQATMAHTGALIPLGQEMDYVEGYLALQTLRYQDALQWSAEIPPALRAAAVPRLCVQPLVENALLHGASPGQRLRRVQISARAEGGCLALWVEDNGPGMDPETLEVFNRNFSAKEFRFERHIGLGNLNQRVRLLFGDGYPLEVEASPLGGLRVWMRLPL
jgi:two-component system sensor histidine kinase YesM